MLTAAVPDGFLVCPTRDPELLSRPAASSPTLISHPAETCKKTLINQKPRMAPCFQFVLCACSVFILLCFVYLFVKCFEITVRSSTIWSTLKDRFTPSYTVWKDAFFPKISSLRTPAHIVCRCRLTEPQSRMCHYRCVSVFQHFDFTPTCIEMGTLRCDM